VRKYFTTPQLAPPGNGHTLASTISQKGWRGSVMEIFGHCPGEEPIPVRGDSKQVNKAEIVVADGDNGVLFLHGRIDIDSSPALRERLLALLRSPHPKIVGIDLSAVNHLDSSGVATLIEMLRIARASRTELRLEGLHDRLLRLFESTGILSLFNKSGGAQLRYEAE
jgi:anti-sigma B factor antagonist